jgi:hypothetical protein
LWTKTDLSSVTYFFGREKGFKFFGLEEFILRHLFFNREKGFNHFGLGEFILSLFFFKLDKGFKLFD